MGASKLFVSLLWIFMLQSVVVVFSQSKYLVKFWKLSQELLVIYFCFAIDVIEQDHCGKHAIYKKYASPCDRTCRELRCPCCLAVSFEMTVVNACRCTSGFARDLNGECISVETYECRREKLKKNKCPKCPSFYF